MKWLVLCSAVILSGCASTMKGTTQQLTVNTAPQGGTCVLSRGGKQIAQVATTPGTVNISKSNQDIDVTCNKAGFPKAVARLNSELEPMTFGNILIGGLIGVAVDYSTGAINKYQPTITVPLDPNARPLPNQPTPKKPPDTPTKPVV